MFLKYKLKTEFLEKKKKIETKSNNFYIILFIKHFN